MLGALAAPVLAGCGGSKHKAAPAPTAVMPPRSLQVAIGAEQTLIGTYTATMRSHPALRSALAVPLAHHQQHALALGGKATPTGEVVPAGARDAVAHLIALETDAFHRRSTQAVSDTGHGSLLAAIAACEATHVDLLQLTLAALPATTTPATTPR